ncbi:MAG: thioredoxin [Rhodomicrobium sp.]
MVTAVTEATFENEVKKADKPVLVDFWAEWCGPCRTVAPILEELSREFDGQLKVVKLDVESNPRIAQAYNIRGIPALLLFKNGQVAGQKIGALPKHQLKAWLSEAVA